MRSYRFVMEVTFKGKPFISAKNSLEPPIENRITTVMIHNDQPLIQPSAQVLTVTDTSTKDLGQPVTVY